MRSIALALLLIASTITQAQETKKPFVHPLFSDHMVLQRGKQIPVWGWAKPGSTVTVSFGSQKHSAKAEASGKWQVKIGPFKANRDGASLQISGDQQQSFKDVLVGDVWVCSGQSNMEWTVAASANARDEIANVQADFDREMSSDD